MTLGLCLYHTHREMGFWFGDTEKIENGEVMREMEREMRFGKDGDRERWRQNKRKGNEKWRERSVEGDEREVVLKGRGRWRRGRGDKRRKRCAGAGRETGGWCETVCVWERENERFSLGCSCREWDFRIHCPPCLKACVCVFVYVCVKEEVFLCVSGVCAV